MNTADALEALSAIAHPSRLEVFKLLVRAGEAGLPAGDVSRGLAAQQNTVSTQLAILTRSSLIRARRDGRSIIYSVDYATFSDLLGFLVEDCCQGRPELCTRLAEVTAPLMHCATKNASAEEIIA